MAESGRFLRKLLYDLCMVADLLLTRADKGVARPMQIGLLLLPAFNSMALHAFVDPLRAANYLHGQALYRWHMLSLYGGTVTASNGLSLTKTLPCTTTSTKYDLLIVNASWTPENFQDKQLQLWLRRLASNGTRLAGLDTGAFVLAYAGLMNGYRASVHYEHLDSYQELFPDSAVTDALYCIDRNRLSCCGGLASADLALELIRQAHGSTLANAAGRYIFHSRPRAGYETQQSHVHGPASQPLPETLRAALRVIEQHLEQLLSVPAWAQQVGVSQRKLERLFHRHLSLSPKRYYLNLRLGRARGLLTQTELSIAEIAAACGFNSTEHFARAYKHHFAINPSLDRQAGRVPFEFRSLEAPH